MAKETTVRHIKLQPKSRRSETLPGGLKDVPWLNVSGVWLERAGFYVGDQVEITVQQGKLTIRQKGSYGDQSH
jgi:toxic protein SymE